jgi:hypothetical protein
MSSDPFNPNHIVVGGRKYTGLYEMDNISTLVSGGAASFTKIFTEGDLALDTVRSIYFDPVQTNTMYVLSGGGLYRCSKNGTTWTSSKIYPTGTLGWADRGVYVWAHNGETRIALSNPVYATNDTDTLLCYSKDRGITWSAMLTLGDVKALYDEGAWYDRWETLYAAAPFGYQNRLVCAVTALRPNRKDLGVFYGDMKNDPVAWENWSGAGAGRFIFSCGRDAALVNAGGIPYVYVATTGAGVWRRALSEVLGSSEAPNLIHNGGFETGLLAPDWDDVWPKLDSTPTNVYAGNYSVLLRRAGAGNMECRQTVACSADTDYTLSAQIKTALTSGSAGLKVQFYANTTLLGTCSNYVVAGTSDYHPLFLDFRTPADTTSVKVFLQIPNSIGSAWFDEVRLQ